MISGRKYSYWSPVTSELISGSLPLDGGELELGVKYPETQSLATMTESPTRIVSPLTISARSPPR